MIDQCGTIHDTGGSFMTNMDKEDSELIMKAAEKTGFEIYIKHKAYDCNGRLIPGNIAVHTGTKGDHSKFWDCFDKLRKLVKG